MPIVARRDRQAARRTAFLGDVQVEPGTEVGGKGEATAVGRPRGIALDGRRRACRPRREHTRLAAVRRHGPDLIEEGDRDARAIGRPRGVAHRRQGPGVLRADDDVQAARPEGGQREEAAEARTREHADRPSAVRQRVLTSRRMVSASARAERPLTSINSSGVPLRGTPGTATRSTRMPSGASTSHTASPMPPAE